MKDPVGNAVRDAEAEVEANSAEPSPSGIRPSAPVDVTEVAEPGPIEPATPTVVDPPNTEPTSQTGTDIDDPPMFGDR